MSVETLSAFLLKLSDGADNPNFSTVAGLKLTRFHIANNPVEKFTDELIREFEAGSIPSLSVTGVGVFTGAYVTSRLKKIAVLGELHMYELAFETTERIRGCFLITGLEDSGTFNGEQRWSLSLKSSGPLEFVE